MSDDPKAWPALSFLEGLRPGPADVVELALLASYSADLGSIGATLLALAGKDTDSGSGSATDFADAVERMRGKVRIVVQRGRIAKMRRTPRIASVLDQFVREVEYDEAVHSWHPKAALVRLRKADGKAEWRLWIGSRNLTECVNRDMGLLLVSDDKLGAPVAGVDDLARDIAARAALPGLRPAAFAAMVRKIAWCAPPGVTVKRLHWFSGETTRAAPKLETEADDIIIVSPFVDKTFLSSQYSLARSPARQILLTTMREIERLGPWLAAINDLRALDAPDYPDADPQPEDDEDDERPAGPDIEPEEAEVGRGLHAKLVFVRRGSERILWLGSANATTRAWTGRNAEVMAELSITPIVEEGLTALIDSARYVETPTQDYQPDAALLDEEALERARAQVAARWAATLEFDADEARIRQSPEALVSPHPDEEGCELMIGALHGELVPWPRGATTISLGAVAAADRSEFIRVRLAAKDRAVSWLQRTPADPPFGVDRDRAAFVRFLGTRGFLLWLADLLANDGRDGDDDWTQEQLGARASMPADTSLDPGLPTLEDILAAWSRDPDHFREIERRVNDYLPAVRAQARLEDPETAALLRRFEQLWRKLQAGLGSGRRQTRR